MAAYDQSLIQEKLFGLQEEMAGIYSLQIKVDTHWSPSNLNSWLFKLWASSEAKYKALKEVKASLVALTSHLTMAEYTLK